MATSYNESTNGATSLTSFATMDENSTFTGFVTANKTNSFFVIAVDYNDLVSFTFSGTNVEQLELDYRFATAGYVQQFGALGGSSFDTEGNGTSPTNIGAHSVGSLSAVGHSGFQQGNFQPNVTSGTGYLIVQVHGFSDPITQNFTLKMTSSTNSPTPPTPVPPTPPTPTPPPTPTNHAPIAVNDTITLSAHTTATSFTLSPLGPNGGSADSDPDAGDTISINSVPFTTPHGTLQWTQNGVATYTPDAGFKTGAFTSDTFTYNIKDNHGAISNTATVTINFTPNHAPTVVAQPVFNVAAGSTTSLTVLSSKYVTDADGDPLTISSSVTGAQHGTATPLGAQGGIQYVASSQGSDTLSYTVSDGFGGTLVTTAQVNVISPTIVWDNPGVSVAKPGAGQTATLNYIFHLTGLDDNSQHGPIKVHYHLSPIGSTVPGQDYVVPPAVDQGDALITVNQGTSSFSIPVVVNGSPEAGNLQFNLVIDALAGDGDKLPNGATSQTYTGTISDNTQPTSVPVPANMSTTGPDLNDAQKEILEGLLFGPLPATLINKVDQNVQSETATTTLKAEGSIANTPGVFETPMSVTDQALIQALQKQAPAQTNTVQFNNSGGGAAANVVNASTLIAAADSATAVTAPPFDPTVTLSVLMASGLPGKVTNSANSAANVLVAGSFEPELGTLGSLTTDYYQTTANGNFVVASYNTTMNSVPEPGTNNAALFAAATNNATPLSAVALGTKIPQIYWQLNSDTGQVTFLQPVTPAITALLTQVASRMNYNIVNPVGFTLNGNPLATNNDVIIGGSGPDVITSGPGNTVMIGGAGNDTMIGGVGNDMFFGGNGDDRLVGGSGLDIAFYSSVVGDYALYSYNGMTVVLTHGGDGKDRMLGVEYLQFTNTAIATSTATPFDPWEYIASNPDLITALGPNPQLGFDHFIDSGYLEGRSINSFDALAYLASNPDLIGAFGLNLSAAAQHYVASGFKEHRPTNSFDAVAYLASNTDVLAVVGFDKIAAEKHYVANGYNEHRPLNSFDALEYLASNPDLITAFGTNTAAAQLHYVQSGFNEHRPTNSFDPIEYIASNGDLIAAFGFNAQLGEQHYVATGFKEHRATTSFDATEYIASNTDLITAFGLNPATATKHYIVNGFKEHRPTTSFDPFEYIASNPDLIGTFGLNALLGEQHYIVSGFKEHRATTSFDATEYLASNPDLILSIGLNTLAAEKHYISSGFGAHRPTNTFDAIEYLASNVDLLATFGFNTLAAEQNYVASGFNAHRPTNSFDPLQYIASNGDLIVAFGVNAQAGKQHYVATGFNEHRPTTSFDPLQYIASNPDLITAFGANKLIGEQHYIVSGFFEHRSTTAFDPFEYLASNPDLILAFGLNQQQAEQHYIASGFNEHRATTSFDAVEYLASNPDLIAAFGFNTLLAEKHYVGSGFNEHRATTSFDPIEYIASNPDLITAFGVNPKLGEQHYVATGFAEHRATTSFDASQYLANYPDLAAAFGGNLALARQHYVASGFLEGRTDKAPVITGDGGDNTLVAKNGAIMNGGGGADNFLFNAALTKPAAINDFAAGTDHLQISASGFGHGLVAGGAATLVTAATAAAATHAGPDGYFIYDNAGTVWWDPNGGGGADAVALAKLAGVGVLHASDFLLSV